MKGTAHCDRTLVWATLLLVLVGMLTVYTASVHVAHYSFGASHVFLDVASVDYRAMSFDDQVVADFAEHIAEPAFDIADHLQGLGYDTLTGPVFSGDQDAGV